MDSLNERVPTINSTFQCFFERLNLTFDFYVVLIPLHKTFNGLSLHPNKERSLFTCSNCFTRLSAPS